MADLTLEQLEQLERLVRKYGDGAGEYMNAQDWLALLAMARRLAELEEAIQFMNDKGHWQNTTPVGIVQRARDFGWSPDRSEGK